MAQKTKRKKPAKRKPTKRRRTRLSVDEIISAIGPTFADMIHEAGPENAKRVVHELMQNSISVVAWLEQLPPERIFVVLPNDGTSRLLSAVQLYAENTGKTGEAVIDQIIGSLGPNFLLN